MPTDYRGRRGRPCASALRAVAHLRRGGDGQGGERGSSLWLKTKSPDLADFAWQNGYDIFSLGFSQIESVRDYIAVQEEHHRKVLFPDEFRQLMRRYEIEFDEWYVWD